MKNNKTQDRYIKEALDEANNFIYKHRLINADQVSYIKKDALKLGKMRFKMAAKEQKKLENPRKCKFCQTTENLAIAGKNINTGVTYYQNYCKSCKNKNRRKSKNQKLCSLCNINPDLAINSINKITGKKYYKPICKDCYNKTRRKNNSKSE